MLEKKDPFRVLVVDDDADLRDMLSEMLDTEGYLVECAPSGEAALKLIDELSKYHDGCAIDAIVSDVQMPNGDGVHLLRGVNQRYRPFERPKVFFLSGGSVYRNRDLVNLGADAVLEKPIRTDILLPYIDKAVLSKKRRTRVVAHLFVEISSEFGRTGIRKAMTLNVAAGGMCLVTGHSGFVPGTDIEFSIAYRDNILRGNGKVRWSNNIGQAHHTGIQFTPDMEENLRPFENLVTELQSEQIF